MTKRTKLTIKYSIIVLIVMAVSSILTGNDDWFEIAANVSAITCLAFNKGYREGQKDRN